MVSYITSKGYNLEQHLKDFRQSDTLDNAIVKGCTEYSLSYMRKLSH